MGFLQVKGVSEDAADTIVAARLERPFRDLADFWRRTSIDRDAIQNLIAVGAFDSLGISRRKLLWQLEDVMAAIPKAAPPRRRNVRSSRRTTDVDQGTFALETDPYSWDQIPELPPMTELDLAGIDMTLQNASARYSVMMFYRRSLKTAGVLSIGEVQTKPDGAVLKTAGIVISRQQPPTAKGMTFLVLSDEEGELPAAIPPQIYERCRRTLSGSASLVVEGTLQRHRQYVSLMIRRLWNMREIATLDDKPFMTDEHNISSRTA
jgi:error-prone DNA polymerase